MHLAYIWIVSHLSAKNYRNWWKFDEVLTKTNLLSFFGTQRNRAKMICGGRPLVPEILDQSVRVGAKSSIFAVFSLVAP